MVADRVEITGGSVDLDGGSTTSFNQSRLDVGAGGLLMENGTINFNAGPSTPEAASVGSILNLLGDVTSTGASHFMRMNTIVATAVVDLNFGDRVFDVEGTLNIGSVAAPITVINGSLTKEGTGTLSLSESVTLDSLTINEGTVALGVSPVPAPAAPGGSDANNVADDAADASSLQAVPEPTSLGFLAAGVLAVLTRQRRTSRI